MYVCIIPILQLALNYHTLLIFFTFKEFLFYFAVCYFLFSEALSTLHVEGIQILEMFIIPNSYAMASGYTSGIRHWRMTPSSQAARKKHMADL